MIITTIRSILAVWACKLTRLLLRILGRGGTALPGRVALTLCPDILSRLSRGVTGIVITGTNGKTTTARILEVALQREGLPYFANRSGSNLKYGIAAEFAANANLLGKPRKTWALIECDEAASKQVCRAIDPKLLVVTNVFRDQLDRFGEVTRTLENIIAGVENSPSALLVLNADCSLCASIADRVPNKSVFYGVEAPLGAGDDPVSDAPRCIRCMARYDYDYRTFGHLGGFRCPQCGYARPAEPLVAVTEVLESSFDAQRARFRIDGVFYDSNVALPGDYNLYNAAAAVAAGVSLGFAPESALAAAADFQCGFGRMEKFRLGETDVRMILVKNPAGCSQVIEYLTRYAEKVLFVCCLNDNFNDGTDVSWIWDARFEGLAAMGERLAGVLVSGIRADDMALRLKYAGLSETLITVICDQNALLDQMLARNCPVVVMPTYSAMLELRALISAKFGYKNFWE